MLLYVYISLINPTFSYKAQFKLQNTIFNHILQIKIFLHNSLYQHMFLKDSIRDVLCI